MDTGFFYCRILQLQIQQIVWQCYKLSAEFFYRN